MRHALVLSAAAILLSCGKPADPQTSPPPPTKSEESYQQTKPPEVGFQLDSGTYDLEPQSETYRCAFVEFDSDEDVDVVRIESTMIEGSHHMNVFSYKDRDPAFPKGTIGRCPDFDPSKQDYVYAAQTPTAKAVLPENVALKFKAHTQFRIEMHYLNPGDTKTKAGVKLNFYGVKPGTITTFANTIVATNLNINIKPGESAVVKGHCTMAHDVRVVGIASHAHKHLVEFTAGFNDGTKVTPLYATKDWEHPEYLYFTPPMLVKQGQSFDYACSYKNNTNTTLTYGGSADDEMCMLVGYYYPYNPNDGAIYCVDIN